MSKYIGEFTSYNGTDYKVEIITKNSETPVVNVTLGGSPFVTEMDSDGKTIFAPIKSQGATVEIVTDGMPFDIYSGQSLGTKVKLTNTTANKVEFVGYVTPCAYTQGFDLERETLEIECVDGIAVLKDIPFTSVGKDVNSFLNIVFSCLKKANCFKTLYVTDNMQFTASSNDSIFEKIRVLEANFFEQEDYSGQPDNELAMNCYDVLFEIMQYMGCTLIADGEDVYIVDYDAIRNGKNKYWKYDISGSTIGTKKEATLSHSHGIKEDSYAENGTTVDLSEVFNKLTVKDDFYTHDDETEGANNSKNWVNITASSDPTLNGWQRTGKYLENGVFTAKNGKGEDESFFIVLVKNWTGRIYFVLGKFYNNPLIETYHYYDSGNSKTSESSWKSNVKYSQLFSNAKGAVCVGLYTQDIEQGVYDNWAHKLWNNNRPPQYIWNSFSSTKKLELFAELSGMAKIEGKKLVNHILCLNYDAGHIEHDKVQNYPYFKLKKDIPSVFGGENGYIVLQGTLIRHDEPSTPFPMNHKDSVNRKNTSIYTGESYFWAQLKWGNKYWNELTNFGTCGGEWVDTPTNFRIPYGNNDKEQKANDFFDQNLSFYNTASKVWGLNDVSGFYIPAPTDMNLEGTIELTVYANKDTKGKKDVKNGKDKKNSYDTYKPKVVLFKELEIKLCFADDALNEDAAKEDTYYSNEVEDYTNVREGEEVSCKICTFDDKTVSYSVATYLDAENKSQYVDELYSKATAISLRPEWHIVHKTVNQYQEPRVVFGANLKNSIGLKPYSTLTDKTLSGRTFIIDTIAKDFRQEKTEVSLVEKTNQYK